MKILSYSDKITNAEMPVTKKLQKLGTVKISAVETTPVVWQGHFLRFEWMRSSAWDSFHKQRDVGFYRFYDMETEEPVGADFAFDRLFGCCYAENGVMYAHGVRGRKIDHDIKSNAETTTNVIDVFWSSDLMNWESKTALVLPEYLRVFNTSVCKGKDGKYVMAIEIAGPHEIVGPHYKCVFAVSDDLLSWELLPIEDHLFRKDRYTACPAIRYFDGFYYVVYLESLPYSRYVPYIVRSADLINWEVSVKNPFMFYDDGDKAVIHPERFTEDELNFINNSVNCNNSDVDFCEFEGKTYILYSWGNQHGKEFLGLATYDGGLEEFLESYF